jgi:hypothetical protein
MCPKAWLKLFLTCNVRHSCKWVCRSQILTDKIWGYVNQVIMLICRPSTDWAQGCYGYVVVQSSGPLMAAFFRDLNGRANSNVFLHIFMSHSPSLATCFGLIRPSSSANESCVQVSTLKNDFWNVTPCGSCKMKVSEELSASIFRVTRVAELGTTLAVTSNRRTLRRNTKRASFSSYG